MKQGETLVAEVIPVILSGGAGTRLWPLSRELRPKQLLPLTGDVTLLQDTAQRIAGRPFVVCNQEHRFIVAEQLREIGIEPRGIVIEPVGRNTAPAAAVAALLAERDPDALLLVMPSDHQVKDTAAFRAAVAKAVPLARAGMLVTFGIQPTEANTGYGYIRRGQPLDGGFKVESFVEKPDRATAEAYLASGEYLWNGGIFLFAASTYLAELGKRLPEMVAQCRTALADGASDLFFFRLADAAFAAIKGQSIDYAVMEHTDRAAVVPVDMGWSDIGSWSALWQESSPDADGNVLLGDVLATATRNSYVRSEGRLVATLGVEDLVVVATDDAVLVADKAHDQDVKKIVEDLKAANRPEASQGTRCWRPWGWFQTIDDGARFRVKHIQVNPGSKLSLQKHWHRSEHWIVVTGTALVTCGDNTFMLRENESTFIPAGTVHRLENPGRVPLRMIEVQSGEYVGEDDIVRIEDDYGR
jgi:mannose-1-phosphate guanylyltransferase/mannose-6-phosphate isomerase